MARPKPVSYLSDNFYLLRGLFLIIGVLLRLRNGNNCCQWGFQVVGDDGQQLILILADFERILVFDVARNVIDNYDDRRLHVPHNSDYVNQVDLLRFDIICLSLGLALRPADYALVNVVDRIHVLHQLALGPGFFLELNLKQLRFNFLREPFLLDFAFLLSEAEVAVFLVNLVVVCGGRLHSGNYVGEDGPVLDFLHRDLVEKARAGLILDEVPLAHLIKERKLDGVRG